MSDKSQRIAIKQVALVKNGAEVCVELSYGDNTYKGSSPAGKDELEQMMAATRALIEAINSILPTPIVKRVAELQKVQFRALTEPVIISLVAIQIRGQEVYYPGAARSDGQLIQAAVRATLDAINRPVGLVL